MTNRRQFLKDLATLGLLSSAYPILTSFTDDAKSNHLKEIITSIELFRYDIDIPRYFSWGTWYNRQHLFMKISSGDFYGWSEIPAAVNNPDFDPSEWVEYLKAFKGLTLDKAQRLLASQQTQVTGVSSKKLEFVEMGLLDLSGKIQNIAAIDLLNLNQRNPVPGLYCILDKDIQKAEKEAISSIEQNLSHHMKFKMYGEKEVDLKLLKTIRDVLGENAVIISDANKGYKDWQSLDDLASILNEFREGGLNAIEDPAELSTEEWIQLQELTGELSLIPDYPMRPAWNGINNIKAGMGRIYNLHPSTMGSFQDTAQLAIKVNEIGAKVMIGDDSLVGPACSAWQQIAIGVGASWVEAIEKKEDSENFINCLKSCPTKKDENGNFSLKPVPGFGVDLDVKSLKRVCKSHISV